MAKWAIADMQTIGWVCIQMQAGLCELNKDVRELVVLEKRKSREVGCRDNRKQWKGREGEEHCVAVLYLSSPSIFKSNVGAFCKHLLPCNSIVSMTPPFSYPHFTTASRQLFEMLVANGMLVTRVGILVQIYSQGVFWPFSSFGRLGR